MSVKYAICVSCNSHDGEVRNNAVAVLSDVPLLRPTRMGADNGVGWITLCRECKAAMPIDLDAMHRAQINMRETIGTPDPLLEAFLRQFITDVWISDRPPSNQELADVLNAVGLWSPRGEAWTSPNIQQKMARMRFDRILVFNMRRPRGEQVDVGDLLATAEAFVRTAMPQPSEQPTAASRPLEYSNAPIEPPPLIGEDYGDDLKADSYPPLE